MSNYSTDILYAYAQLGLEAGASLEAIQEILTHAKAYRFSTKERIDRVRPFVDFFMARSRLGAFDASFTDIKKLYHKKAMALHPDRNWGNKVTEEQLKEINAAYALVAEINRQAKDYFNQNEVFRRESEQEAREETSKERPAGAKKKSAQPQQAKPASAPPQATTGQQGARKYMAASVPRSIRAARLGYLPVHAIIGCKFTKKENDFNIIFDIIMLPEDQFLRAKSYLSTPDLAGAHLQYGKFSPAFIPKDTHEVFVPPDEQDPESFAKSHFMKVFGL